MCSIEVVFKEITEDLFDTVYGLSVKDIDEDEKKLITFNESILYLKSVVLTYGVTYGEISGTLCVAFSKVFLDILEKKSEKVVQSFFPIISCDLLFSNIIGLIVYAVNTKLKSTFSNVAFDLPVDVSIKKFLKQNKLLALSYRNKSVAYVSFSFFDKI